ncbi:hypothetical protein Tco_0511010, partial [Tanacetum coccineum]
MAYFVAILTPDSARSCVMQSTLPTKGMRSIISTVSISLEDFLPSILLLIGYEAVTFPSMVASRGWSFASAVPGQMTHLVAISTLDSANSCVMQGASCTQRAVSMVIFGRISPNSFLSSMLLLVVIIVMVVFVVVIWVVIFVNVIVGVIIVVVFGIVVVGLLALAIDAACAFRAEEMPSLISCRMAAKVMAGVSDVDVLLGGILSTQDNAYFSRTKKYRGSNSSDDGNIDDGVKIAGGVIRSGGEI